MADLITEQANNKYDKEEGEAVPNILTNLRFRIKLLHSGSRKI